MSCVPLVQYNLARFSKCTLRRFIRGHSFQFTEGEPTCGLTGLYFNLVSA